MNTPLWFRQNCSNEEGAGLRGRLRRLSCGVSLGKMMLMRRDPRTLMPSVSNEALDIFILAQNMLNSVSKDAMKLLVFTDNRQEAAFPGSLHKPEIEEV
ncbi:hypothetical protein [Mesotoga sp.]|uniref:hypothetical protein n=1 Tax=Mesotoga sp. TaxID=2053577 RepID=UPI00345E3B85